MDLETFNLPHQPVAFSGDCSDGNPELGFNRKGGRAGALVVDVRIGCGRGGGGACVTSFCPAHLQGKAMQICAILVLLLTARTAPRLQQIFAAVAIIVLGAFVLSQGACHLHKVRGISRRPKKAEARGLHDGAFQAQSRFSEMDRREGHCSLESKFNTQNERHEPVVAYIVTTRKKKLLESIVSAVAMSLCPSFRRLST